MPEGELSLPGRRFMPEPAKAGLANSQGRVYPGRWYRSRLPSANVPVGRVAQAPLSSGSMISSNGEGAGWTGLASVAMVGSLRDFDWPRAPFRTCWHVGRETLRGWSAVFCVDRQSISVKRAHLPCIQTAFRRSGGDRN